MLTDWVERRIVLTRAHLVPFFLKQPIAVRVDVQYMLTGWVERWIVLTRVHVVPFSLKQLIAARDLRPREGGVVKSSSANQLGLIRDASESSDIGDERTVVGWLKFGLSSRNHEKFGWLRGSLRSIGKIGEGWRRCGIAFCMIVKSSWHILRECMRAVRQ